jgi:hypothetical protein
MKFNAILKLTLQFTFTNEELGLLRRMIVEYVVEYERYLICLLLFAIKLTMST